MSGKRMWVAVVVALSGAVAAAQTPQTPPSGAQKAAADSPAVTVVGCVQKQSDVAKSNPMVAGGMGDEFVLTAATLNQSADSPKTETPAPTGTSGTLATGKVFRVTGDKEKELKDYVGQRVEIAGTFKHPEDAKDMGAAASASAETNPAHAPEITIDSIKPATGSCAPAIK